MLCSIFHRRFLQIVGVLALINLLSLEVSGPARAQTIVSGSFDRFTKILTALDSVGNRYTANLSTFSPTSKSSVAGTFTPPSGTTQPVTFTVNPVGAGQFAVTSDLPTQSLLACSVNTVSISAACELADTPRSLVASIKAEVHSQSNTVIGMITDRLRTLSRDLAQGSAASLETPPGGTVILDNFSSNPVPKYNGLSAGSDVARWGLWANASGSFLNNDNPANPLDGTSVVALTGLDYIVDRQWIFGVSAGYTHADLSLSPSSVTRQADGALVGPYAAYVIGPNWSVDALVNWTSLSNNISAPTPFPSGSYNSNRVTAASNLNYFTNYDAIKLTGFGGYAYTWEGGNPGAVLGSALANNIRYGAIRIGGEAAYDFGAFEPYLPLTFEYETTTPNDGTSRAALVLGAGLRYRWSDTLTGGLLVETTELKTHTRDVLVGAHLRWSF
jgi:uncharacterized protein with beta-barrel porin domain